MVQYTLAVKIDQAHVKQFNDPKNNFQLCFAAGVSTSASGKPTYNVVAATHKVGATVTITWTEEYAIGASDSTFSNGVKFNAATDVVPIDFGQAYTQPSDFTNGSINQNSDAPADGFLFINKAQAAAAVVYKKVLGAWSPIYISSAAPLPPGTETLIPKVSCAIWFSSSAETSNMISEFDTISQIIDLTQNQSHAATVQYDGNWTIKSNT